MSMLSLSKQMLLWLMILMLPATPLQSQIASADHSMQPTASFLPPAYEQNGEQRIAPAQLELLGYMLGHVWKVVANQTIAVALTPGDLVMLDIRKPEQPRIVSRLSLSTIYQGARFFMADLAMVGNYVFVSCSYCGDTGLIVVNVSVPTAPAVVGRMKTTGYVDVVKAYGELLYMALGGDQLAIVDIRTPNSPKLLGAQHVSGQFAYVRDIEIMETAGGRYAFVVAQNGKLVIFDVTTPTAPVELAIYAPERACMMDAAMVRSSDQVHLYVIDCYVGLRVLDMTVPTQPQELQSYHFAQDHEAYAITAVDHLLFVTTDVESISARDTTLHILDAANATTLTEVSTFHDFLYASDMADSEQMLVMADEHGIQLLDFTDPAALHKVGHQINVSAYSDLDSDGRYLYLVDPTGFKVIDTINPVLPVYVAEVPMPYALNVEVDAGFALVTDAQAGLWILDIHQATHPTVVSHTTTPISTTTDVVISGTLGTSATAFIGGVLCTDLHFFGCPPSLIAVDLTNLQQPVSSIMLADDRGIADMIQLGDFLYLTTGSPGLLSMSELLVFDIANPQLPIQVAQTALLSTASSMAVVGQALYIALADTLQTYDISNPAAPILKHTLSLSRRFDSISVDQGFLYGKDGSNLTLVSLGDPFQPVVIERQALPSTGGSGIVAANGLIADNGFVYVLNEGLTMWRHQTDLLGRVFDAWGEPQAGIRIDATSHAGAAAADETATFTFSGLTGGYALPDNMTSTYTIQPTMTGHSVWPPTRQDVAPDTQDAQDFYLLAQPVSTTVASATAATLSYVDGRDLPTVVAIPAGAIAQSTVVHLIPIMAFDQDDIKFTGNAFALQVGKSATQVEKLTFEQPVTVTIHYSDQGANALLDESSYQLMLEVNSKWQPLPDAEQAQGIVRKLAGNSLAVSVRATGRYALFGKTHSTYLPLVAQ